jgi:hypothetical protein
MSTRLSDIQKIDPSILTEDQKVEAKAKREQLMAWLLTLPQGDDIAKKQLLSRQSQDFPWEATGFHVSLKDELVFAKVGRHPFQPIGQITDDYFMPLAGSQLLWRREFVMADISVVAGAFTVEDLPPIHTDTATETDLTDREREIMSGELEELTKAVAEFKIKDDGKKPEIGPDPQDDLIDALKLSLMRVPRLEKYYNFSCEKFREQSNGRELLDLATSGRSVTEVVRGMTEWMDMKLQDDRLRREVESTVMTVPKEERGIKLKQVLLAKLDNALTSADDVKIQAAVDSVYVSSSDLRTKMRIRKEAEPDVSLVEMAQWLRSELS